MTSSYIIDKLKIVGFPNTDTSIFVETDAIKQNYPDISLNLATTLKFTNCERGEVFKNNSYGG